MEEKSLKKILKTAKKVFAELDTLKGLCEESGFAIKVGELSLVSFDLPKVRDVLGGDLKLVDVMGGKEGVLEVEGVKVWDPFVPEWEWEDYE